MAPWETRPNLGRYGAILLAPQTAVGTPATVPIITLLATAFMPPLEQLIRTKDAGATATIRNRRSRIQGIQADGRQVSCEMTLTALAELCKSIGTVAASVLTPSDSNFAPNAPGIPWTVWQLHPTGDRIATDVQIGAIALTVGARTNVTASITLNVTSSQLLTGAAPTVVLPQDMLQFKHWWLKVNDVLYKPESGSINLTIPMATVDGANGTNPSAANYPQGWERSDSPMLGVNFTLPGLIAALRTAYEQNTLVKIDAGFTLPGTTPRTIEFNIATAELNSVNIPTGTERIAVPYEAMGVSADSLAEFSIKIPAA